MTSGPEEIRRRMEQARVLDDGAGPEPERDDAAPDEVDAPPAPESGDAIDPAAVERCAKLDLSDTDNGLRLREHFGRDLATVALDEDPGGVWSVWDGRRWDRENGEAEVLKRAQRIGARIAAEAVHLAATAEEKAAIEAAAGLPDDDDSRSAKALRAQASAAAAAIRARRRRRWGFAVSAKNQSRINAMMAMAAPHLRRPASGFNPDPLLVATEAHTLRFVVEDDLECPDPAVTRKKARVEAIAGFRREDWATGWIPVVWDPEARCPKFLAFLAEMIPEPDLRRTVQAYSATGMLGALEQRVAYHYGLGANGKSMFLTVLGAVIGPSIGVGLPKETIMGQGERGAGQASPDLIRLFAKRMVRIDELKDGELLREELVKRLTGGDPMVVRGLYNGYLEFPNVATPHMSGNGQPKIDGTDEGIWRRIIVIHWSVTIPEARRRNFNEMVADLLTERAGILNWLIEGAIDYLENGLYIAASARAATAEYRAEMDPVGEFRGHCLVASPGARVQAARLYSAYRAWARANNRSEFSATRFGREMKRWVKRDQTGSARFYLDVELTDQAAAMVDDAGPGPREEDE